MRKKREPVVLSAWLFDVMLVMAGLGGGAVLFLAGTPPEQWQEAKFEYRLEHPPAPPPRFFDVDLPGRRSPAMNPATPAPRPGDIRSGCAATSVARDLPGSGAASRRNS
jgi:hypothetical protein